MSVPHDEVPPPLGSYRFEHLVRTDVLGEVWAGREENSEALVHLRLLPDGFAADEVEKIVSEAKELEHPALERTLGCVIEEGRMAIITEACEGETLSEKLNRKAGEAVAWPDVCVGMRDWVEALLYLHDHHLPHGGVSEQSLRLDGEKGRLTDLAASYLLRSDEKHRDRFAKQLLSPHALDGGPPTFTDDVYAFGVTLVEWITGKAVGESAEEKQETLKVLREKGEAEEATLPVAVADWIEGALSDEPGQRPQWGELREALAEWTEDSGSTADEASDKETVIEEPKIEEVVEARKEIAEEVEEEDLENEPDLLFAPTLPLVATAKKEPADEVVPAGKSTAILNEVALVEREADGEVPRPLPPVSGAVKVFWAISAAAVITIVVLLIGIVMPGGSNEVAEGPAGGAEDAEAVAEVEPNPVVATATEPAKTEAEGNKGAAVPTEAVVETPAASEKKDEAKVLGGMVAETVKKAEAIEAPAEPLDFLDKADADLARLWVLSGNQNLALAYKTSQVEEFIKGLKEAPADVAKTTELHDIQAAAERLLSNLQQRAELTPKSPLDIGGIFENSPYRDYSLNGRKRILSAAQTALKSLEMYSKEPNGTTGPATHDALLAFQRTKNLVPSAALDTGTLNALGLVDFKDDTTPLVAEAATTTNSVTVRRAAAAPAKAEEDRGFFRRVGRLFGRDRN